MSEFLPPANSYVQIGPIDDVIVVNEAGDMGTFQRRSPGALVIGSDGSREMLAYDMSIEAEDEEQCACLLPLDIRSLDDPHYQRLWSGPPT